MNQASSERFLLGLILVGFVVSLLGLKTRYAAENSNRVTEIVLDAKSLREWEQIRPELRPKLLEHGIGSLAVHELLLEDLVDRSLVTAFSEQEFGFALNAGSFADEDPALIQAARKFHEGRESEPGCYLVFRKPELAKSVKQHLDVTVAGESKSTEIGDGRFVWVPLSPRAMKTHGLGFNQVELQKLVSDGFSIWLRPQNVPGLRAEQIKALFTQWQGLVEADKIHGIVFGGGANEALGYPDAASLKLSAEQLVNEGREWRLGYVELAPKAQQDGIETMVRTAPTAITRVLAVSAPHQAKLTPERVLGMYSLGSRERNIRLLYVRPFAIPGKPELDDRFLFKLSAELKEQAGQKADVFAPVPPPSQLQAALIALGAGALAILLLQAMGLASTPAAWWLALLALPVVGVFASEVVGRYSLYRSLLALAVGMGGPCLAFLRFLYPSLAQEQPKGNSLLEGARLLFLLSLVSLASGLCVAALLTDTTFLLGLDRFRGVKLLTLGTPVLIVVLCVIKHYPVNLLINGMKASIQVYQAVLVGGLGLVFGFLYLRTGNDAGGAASEWERNLRVVLDRFLGVRPRFKEFLVAHPAMVCAPFLARKTGFLPSLVLILLAAVGQAGIVDTFAHIHTPLDVTLVRVILGVVFGLLFGAVAWGFIHLLWGLASKQLARVTISAS